MSVCECVCTYQFHIRGDGEARGGYEGFFTVLLFPFCG